MDSTPPTQPSTHSAPSSFFVWEPAGERIAVHLSGEAVDQIGFAVMRGFGALPKRGAEIGGLLLGRVETGGKTVVTIEEFVGIPCAHLYGPSYILCQEDMRALDREMAAHSAGSGARLRVVGFVRSHTRDPLRLDETDLALLDARFLDEDAVCLLVRPFTTHPSVAVFLTREDGRFSGEAQHETFVFRRKEMQLPPPPKRERGARPSEAAGERTHEKQIPETAERPPAEWPVASPPFAGEPGPELDTARMGRRRVRRSPPPAAVAWPAESDNAELGQDSLPSPTVHGESGLPTASTSAPKFQADARQTPVRRYRWAWLWLPLVFLVLGGFIGVALVLTMNASQNQALNVDPYDLRLSVSRAGESYELKWNPQMPALREARSGELRIEEGTASKTQPLSAGDLARGGIIYRGASAPVRFRLTLFLRGRASFTETVETQPEVR
jgi:hypothetical protein